MAVYRRSARPRFTLLLLVLTSVTAITLDFRGDAGGVIDAVKGGARDAWAPVQDAARAVTDPVASFFEGALNYDELEEENARLREQLAEVEGDRLEAKAAERQLRALHDLQNLEFVGDVPTVAARVVSASASNFDLSIEIDRGRDNGVTKGMPVVAGRGLVGRVVDASRTRATVRLLTDPESSIGVRLTGSGEVGIATGRGARHVLTVDLIDPNVKVGKGELAVTSGLQQSIFPPDIPVGRVTSAKTRPGALKQDITLEPVVDLRRLTFVKVLQWRAP